MTYQKMHEEIDKKKQEADGNYDGFLGYCKNFEFKIRDDGGYSCYTEIIAMGEVLESLKGRSEDIDGNERFAITFEEYLTATTGIDRNTTSLKDTRVEAYTSSFQSADKFLNPLAYTNEPVTEDTDLINLDKGMYDATIEVSRTYDDWVDSRMYQYLKYDGNLSKHLYPVDMLELFLIALDDTNRKKEVFRLIRQNLSAEQYDGIYDGGWGGAADLASAVRKEEDLYKLSSQNVGIKITDYLRLIEMVADILNLNVGDRFATQGKLEGDVLEIQDVIDFVEHGLLYDMNYLMEDTWDYDGPDDKSYTNPDWFESTWNVWSQDKYFEDDNPVYIRNLDGNFHIQSTAPLKLRGTDAPVESVPANYIRWDFLCEIINKFAIPSYNKTKNTEGQSILNREGIVNITYLRDNINNRNKNEYLSYSKFFIPDAEAIDHREEFTDLGQLVDRSIDPGVCFLPNQSFIASRNLRYSKISGMVSPFARGIPEHSTMPDFDPANNPQDWDPDHMETYANHEDVMGGMHPLRGLNKDNKLNSIGYIYLNLKHLRDTYKELRYSEESDGERSFRKDFSLFKFLEKVWDDVNKATSDIHDFRLQTIHDQPNTIRVIDLQFDSDNLTERENFFELDIEGKNSIVRSFNYSSTIPSSLSATIAIAAQATQDVDDLESVTFAAFNHNIKSRFSNDTNLQDPIEEYTKKRAQLLKDITMLGRYFGDVESGLGWYNVDINTPIPLVHKDTAYRLVQNIQKNIVVLNSRHPINHEEENKRGRLKPANELEMGKSAIIPLNFNARLDGIGGLVIGNIFKINKKHLPQSYQEDNINFVVLKESQKISDGQDWVTDISGQLIIADRKHIPVVTGRQISQGNRESELNELFVSASGDTPNADVIRDYYRGWTHPNGTGRVVEGGTGTISTNPGMDDSGLPLDQQVGKLTKSSQFGGGDVVLEMAKLFIKVVDNILELEPDTTVYISSGRRAGHTTSAHDTGNAIDFILTSLLVYENRRWRPTSTLPNGMPGMLPRQYKAGIDVISYFMATEPNCFFINEVMKSPRLLVAESGYSAGKWTPKASGDHFHLCYAIYNSTSYPYQVKGVKKAPFKWLDTRTEVQNNELGGGARRNGWSGDVGDNDYNAQKLVNDEGELCPGEGKLVQQKRLQEGAITVPPLEGGGRIIDIQSFDEVTYNDLVDASEYYNDFKFYETPQNPTRDPGAQFPETFPDLQGDTVYSD